MSDVESVRREQGDPFSICHYIVLFDPVQFHPAGTTPKTNTKFPAVFVLQQQRCRIRLALPQLPTQAVFAGHNGPAVQVAAGLGGRLNRFNTMTAIEGFGLFVQNIVVTA